MLFMTSATGLLLLALRGQPVMPLLLVVHLGFVLGLFLTLPYGKFVHGHLSDGGPDGLRVGGPP